MKRIWRKAILWPIEQWQALFALWMLWRIREPKSKYPRHLVCPACGTRSKAWLEFVADSANPAASVLASRCERCKAVRPMPPIYKADGWLPAATPRQKEDPNLFPIQH